MPRAKRLKSHPDRDTTAAYAASQPLFSALRHAITALDTTKASLADARDIVQSLHVKIANDDQHNDRRRHEAYVSAALNAWKSSTDAFCKVFEELVNVAAPDPTEGRESGPRYEEFQVMLQTAQTARDLVSQSSPEDGQGNSKSESEEEDEDRDSKMEEGARDAASRMEPAAFLNGLGKRPMTDLPDGWDDQKPSGKTSKGDRDIRYSKGRDQVLWENNKLKVPYKSLEADEKKAWNIIASRQKHHDRIKKQKQKRATADTETNDSPADIASAAHTASTTLDPNIEFEDVSAEVEARLKAKQEKKVAEKAKKAAKKRKRDSGDSFGNVVHEGTVDPLDASQQSLTGKPQKPARKKARPDNVKRTNPKADETGTTIETPLNTAKKRKDVDDRPGGFGIIGAQKKQKKMKS